MGPQQLSLSRPTLSARLDSSSLEVTSALHYPMNLCNLLRGHFFVFYISCKNMWGSGWCVLLCVGFFFFKKSIYIWEVFCDNGTEELRVTSSYSSNMVFTERDHALALVFACWLGKVWETLIFLSNVTVHSVDWESQKVIYSSYSLFEIACCSRLLIKQVTLCRRANELLCHTDLPCLALAFSKLN